MYLVLAVAVIGGLLWVASPAGKRGRRLRQGGLRNRYLRLLNMPPRLGEETLNRTLRDLQLRHPNHSKSWYLRKMIADLERDRR